MLKLRHSRNNEPLIVEWDNAYLSAVLTACDDDPANDQTYVDGLDELFKTGYHVMVQDHTIRSSRGPIEFKAKDLLEAWR